MSVRLVRASDGARTRLIVRKISPNPLRSFLLVEELSSQACRISGIFGFHSDSFTWDGEIDFSALKGKAQGSVKPVAAPD